jgi:3-hydroxy-9,10-secoandrosta-1,3,5(10)-triene-9,17-dione monooxygenase
MVGYFPERAQQEFYATGPATLCSSSFFAGRDIQATPTDGGLRIAGRWEFSSGSDPASWALLGVGPPGLIALVPRSDYEILDTWHASGLCGSGSNDLLVREAFVPGYRLLDINRAGLDDRRAWELHGRLSYRLPLRVPLAWDLVAPLLGIVQAALDNFVERARRSPRMAESDVVQLRLAESAAEIDAARTLFGHAIERLLAKAAHDEPFSDLERARNQRDRAFVVRLCMQAVNRLFDSSGGHALFLSEPLQRCHRDAHAVAHRAGLMLDSVGPLYGRALLAETAGPSEPAGR